MDKKALVRIFFPDIRLLRDAVMRRLIAQDMCYAPLRELSDAAINGNKNSYQTIIDNLKKQWPNRVAIERRAYDSFLKKSVFSVNDGSFDDYLFTFATWGFRVDEYFLLHLFELPLKERGSYLSDRDKNIISRGLDDLVDRGDLSSKHLTYRKAPYLFHRESVVLGNRSQENDFISFMRRHHIGVIKVSDEMEGKGVSLVKEEEIDDLSAFYRSNVLGTRSLLEELIVQSPQMAKLNPSTVNTVRIQAFRTSDDIVLAYCFLKIGRMGAFVDNAAAGGVFADVDSRTGIVTTDGADEIGNRFTVHPDHGYILKGIQLPDWDGAVRIAQDAMNAFPTMAYVGWDCAHTKNGWVLVEGNTAGLFMPTEVALQRGIKQEIKAIVSTIDSANTPLVLECFR